MSILPVFQIGVWNAWMLLLYYPLQPALMLVIDKLAGTSGIYQKLAGSTSDPTSRRVGLAATALTYLLLLYSIFLPLKLHTAWLAVGMAVYLLGLACFVTALFNVAATPNGEPFVRGMYRCSRHPLYLFSSLTFIGAGIAAASWLFILLTAILMILFGVYALAEERDCLELFGDRYRQYLQSTPRWFGISRSTNWH